MGCHRVPGQAFTCLRSTAGRLLPRHPLRTCQHRSPLGLFYSGKQDFWAFKLDVLGIHCTVLETRTDETVISRPKCCPIQKYQVIFRSPQKLTAWPPAFYRAVTAELFTIFRN